MNQPRPPGCVLPYHLAYQIGMLRLMASEQIAVRLPRELLDEVDDLVSRGVYESRAAAVRAGVEAVAESERRRQVDQAVIEGYQRHPAGVGEREAAIASLRDAILEEPW
jgi:Arc/MetJ-type ribon-helix-helix transcriptional regulator